MEHLGNLKAQAKQTVEDLDNPGLEPALREALLKEKGEVENKSSDQALLLLFFDNDFASKLGLGENMKGNLSTCSA